MSKVFHKVTRLYQPIIHNPNGARKSDNCSKSYQMMLDMGIIAPSNPGMYTLLPLGLRSLEKLITIVDKEMRNIGGQKLLLPNLTSTKLWEKTGRLDDMCTELFQLRDRHGSSFILSPTYEEAITNLIASTGKIKKSSLPLLLYQISNKWRDEMKPRLGLLRSREFIMKDLYSFDIDPENSQKSYNSVTFAYKKILKKIGLPYLIADGDSGTMGGSISHEYLYESPIGEDKILVCKECNSAINSILLNEEEDKKCKNKCTKGFDEVTAIEVGHTFLLDKKYSKPLGAVYQIDGKNVPLTMGCYGLGLTRLITASVETMSTNKQLKWPRAIAPFTVYLIPPKEHTDADNAKNFVDVILDVLDGVNVDAIVDDRTIMSIGKRMVNAKLTGYPYIIVIGKSAVLDNPLFEVFDVNNSEKFDFSLEQLTDFFGRLNSTDSIDDDKVQNVFNIASSV